MRLVSGIALNKYRCEYGTLNSMFAGNFCVSTRGVILKKTSGGHLKRGRHLAVKLKRSIGNISNAKLRR